MSRFGLSLALPPQSAGPELVALSRSRIDFGGAPPASVLHALHSFFVRWLDLGLYAAILDSFCIVASECTKRYLIMNTLTSDYRYEKFLFFARLHVQYVCTFTQPHT